MHWLEQKSYCMKRKLRGGGKLWNGLWHFHGYHFRSHIFTIIQPLCTGPWGVPGNVFELPQSAVLSPQVRRRCHRRKEIGHWVYNLVLWDHGFFVPQVCLLSCTVKDKMHIPEVYSPLLFLESSFPLPLSQQVTDWALCVSACTKGSVMMRVRGCRDGARDIRKKWVDANGWETHH